jgi:hypothetical protein
VETELAPVTVEYVFALQSVQATFPETALYWPAGHCVHAPPVFEKICNSTTTI